MRQKNGFKDGIPMHGTLVIIARDTKTGLPARNIPRIEIRNKITFLAADVLVELWAQRATDPAPLYDQIYSMRMGTSNTAASRADTNLGAYVVGAQLLDVNKVTGIPGEIAFIATLSAGDANGVTLQEAGLFTRGNAVTAHPQNVDVVSDVPGTTPGTPRMIAHQVHLPIPKSAAITVEYQWRVSFTA